MVNVRYSHGIIHITAFAFEIFFSITEIRQVNFIVLHVPWGYMWLFTPSKNQSNICSDVIILRFKFYGGLNGYTEDRLKYMYLFTVFPVCYRYRIHCTVIIQANVFPVVRKKYYHWSPRKASFTTTWDEAVNIYTYSKCKQLKYFQ